MIKSLNLSDFTCFSHNIIEFSKGINVLIGKNGTGKTHIMKCLTATLKANEEFKHSTAQTRDKYNELLSDKLMSYFKPDALGRLVNKNSKSSSVGVEFFTGDKIEYGFSTGMKLVKSDVANYIQTSPFLYIPPREVFSLFEGFIGLYERREISFDQSYVDLAKALNVTPLKGAPYQKAIKMVQPILEKWDIQVVQKNNRFYVIEQGKEYEAHLVAEGLRKVATILYLVSNGELKENSILFWDEPEANLNPSLISVIADLLLSLNKHGIQIFIATHDFLLTHRLSLHAEYPNVENPVDFAFFNLEKQENKLVIEKGTSLVEIQNNAILNEYAAFYDEETRLINSK